jgi:Spy/CpxP family protein refolding chaperone
MMRGRFALLAAALLFLAAPALAQYAPVQGGANYTAAPGQHHPTPPYDAHFGGNVFPPELVMANQKAIGLDDDQKAYIRAQIREAQTRFTDLQWDLQDAMETLQSLLEQDQVSEQQVLGQLEKVLETERQIKRTQMSLMIRIKNKLTAEQRTRLRQLPYAPGPPSPPSPPASN